jgi:catalase
MDEAARERLVGNIVAHFGGAQKRIQMRQTALFHKADPEYGKKVAEELGLEMNEIERLSELSQEERAAATAG